MEKDYKAFENELEGSKKYVEKLMKENPLALGVLMYKVMEERENTNRLLKTILNKIERLEKRIEMIEESKNEIKVRKKDVLLSEADERIIEIIRRLGKATAKEIAKEMNYRGANAASARMNRLYEQGILLKKRVGKKVYFFLK